MLASAILLWGMTSVLAPTAIPVSGDQEPSLEGLPVAGWEIEKFVVAELETKNVSRWARELSVEPWPDEPSQWMLRFSVLRRAGHEGTLIRLLDALATTAENPPGRPEQQQMVRALVDGEWWEAVQHYCERLPEAHPDCVQLLVRHWEEAGREPEWIDEWLVARDRDDPSKVEDQAFLSVSPLRFWAAVRLEFRHRRGTEAALIEELAQAVRDDPTDGDAALRYLAAVSRLPSDAYDPSWLGTVALPQSVVRCYDLGSGLSRLRPKDAIPLLVRSLELEFSDEDRRIMEWRSRRTVVCFVFDVPPRPAEEIVRDGARHQLMRAYSASGEAQKAQELLEELTERYPNGIPPSGLAEYAGAVQAASGARVIEGRIREAEPAKGDSYEYWRERAEYFAGRREMDGAIQAYETALELVEPAEYELEEGQGENFARSLVLGDYCRFLGPNEASMRVLWRELEAVDPGTAYAWRVVSEMLDTEQNNTYFLEPDDDRLWAVLEARPTWGYSEQPLLMRFAENARRSPRSQRTDRRAELWARAEALVEGADPSRAECLGWVMTRNDEVQRAIPLLVDARSRFTDDESIGRASFTLFDAFLDLKDWRAAEVLWPSARSRLTPRELPEWQGRLGILAAKAGDRDDALRLWKQRSNLDLNDLRGLEELANAGLREELEAFYEQLAADDPESVVPGAALHRLAPDKPAKR